MKKRISIIFLLTILLVGCQVNSNSSSQNNSSLSSSDNSSTIENASTTSTSNIKPTHGGTLILNNIDSENNTVRIYREYFTLSDIPVFEYEDKYISNWYFDEELTEVLVENEKYPLDTYVNLYPEFTMYTINEFLIDSVSSIYIETENDVKVTSKEEYTNATFKIVDENVTSYNTDLLSTRIKCRGNSSYWNVYLDGDSFENSKFSYKLKFDSKQNLFGFGKDKEWNLIANFMDRSFIRNHLAYALTKMMDNIEYAIDYHYVELYMNNEYQGLYMLTESVKTGDNRVDIETYYDENTSEIPFLLELDYKVYDDGSEENVNYFHNIRGIPFSTKYPDNFTSECITSAQFTYIKDTLNELYEKVKTSEYSSYLDVDNFIDYFLIQEIFRNVDINHSSVYIYKEVGEKFKMGPIWDFDLSIGNYDYIASHSEGFLKYFVGGNGNYLYNKLMERPAFKNALITRFNEVKDTYLKMLQESFDEIITVLKPYAERDYAKWRTLNNRVQMLANNPDLVSITSFEGHIKYIEDYLFNGITSNGAHYQGRIDWLSDKYTSY